VSITRIGAERRQEASSALRDLGFNEIELSEQRRASCQARPLDIRAPVSGVSTDAGLRAASVIRPADPVLYLVPQDRPLIIASQVEPIHVDQVHVGQEVTLRFSAFDQRETPELIGHVTQVSADAFQEQNTGRSFYRADITIDEGELARLPDGLALIPGMPVEAFIRTGERTPLSYLFKPITDYLAKAFRET
jgi:HlyD family secretion protein